MIIPNGYIATVTTTGGGMTPDGTPIPVATHVGTQIQCNLAEIENQPSGNAENAFQQKSYEVTVEYPFEIQSDNVVLFDFAGVEIGTFHIKSVRVHNFVGNVVIKV